MLFEKKDLKLIWSVENSGITANLNQNLQDFQINQFTFSYPPANSSTVEYTLLELNLFFRRVDAIYRVTVLLPFTVLVVVSWFGFSMRQKHMLLKVAIPLICFVTLTLSLFLIRKEFPQTKEGTAIDVFTEACRLFIFGSLLESWFVYCNYSKHYNSRTENAEPDKFDSISIPAFPLLFVLFNIFFYTHYG